MFKVGSCEEDLFSSMQKILVKNQEEANNYGINKLAKAADLLNEAASIFDKAGMYDKADEVTEIILSLAQDEEVNEDDDEDAANTAPPIQPITPNTTQIPAPKKPQQHPTQKPHHHGRKHSVGPWQPPPEGHHNKGGS
jgi:hypothetical protein